MYSSDSAPVIWLYFLISSEFNETEMKGILQGFLWLFYHIYYTFEYAMSNWWYGTVQKPELTTI